MSTPCDKAVVQRPSWTWPINLSKYDRRPRLTSNELFALKGYMDRFKNHNPNQPQGFYIVMRRLTVPIHDVFDLTGLPKHDRYQATNYLLREMCRRERSFWGWSPAEWIETIRTQLSFRQHHMAVAYLLCGFADFHSATDGVFVQVHFAKKIFGTEAVTTAIERVRNILAGWGSGKQQLRQGVPRTVSEALLINRSPQLEDLSVDVLETMRRNSPVTRSHNSTLALSNVLASLRIIPHPLNIRFRGQPRADVPRRLGAVPSDWARWSQHWHDTSTLSPRTRTMSYYALLGIGRWLGSERPEMGSPECWTQSFATEFVAVIDRMKCGDGADRSDWFASTKGKPLSPGTKARRLGVLRTFFQDLQEWEAIPRRFDPRRCFRTPKAILAKIGPKPRPIEDDTWAKLLWAGLNLTVEDLSATFYEEKTGARVAWYPIEIIRALVMVWLFAGLRRDEILRLRVACIRWQRNGASSTISGDGQKPAVCLLDVPVNKTSAAFTKPVDRVVGEAVEAWESIRPPQPKVLDEKTGEYADYLFIYRAKRVGPNYLNNILIPALCNKAGVPTADCRGNITTHRGRSTIATQLYTAKEPMSLFELQQWLGHRNIQSTQYYAAITPTKLAAAYADAGYFGRNLRAVEVLIDRQAVSSGRAAHEPWKFYDLGHGYCTYDFFDQCPHRMACAKCNFYLPKGSSQALLLEGKAHLLRMRQDIPLNAAELAAVDDGVSALDKLMAQLADVPTPAGPTPRQLQDAGLIQITAISREGSVNETSVGGL